MHGLTFGRSRIWFASRSSSSKLLAYRIISSGTVLNVQCRLSTYSTCRLHPFKKPGTHLNILESFLEDILLKRLHLDKILLTSQHDFVVAQFISYYFFAQINSSFKLFLCSQLNSFHIVYFNNHSKFLIETYGSLSQSTSMKIWPTFYAVNSLISKAISSFNVWFSSNFCPITMIRIPLNWCLAVNASSFNPVVYVKCGTV